MAYKPKATVNTASDDVINGIMNAIDTRSAGEKGAMPRVTGDNAGERDKSRMIVGQFLDRNDELFEKFFHTLLVRIIKVVYTVDSYENPLANLKGGLLEAGDIIEEIAFDLCDPHQYDSTEDTAFPKQEVLNVVAAVHKVNYEKYYKSTINRVKVLKAFTSRDGMEELINHIVERMYTSSNVDEFTLFKYVVGRAALNGEILSETISFNETASEDEKKRSLATVKKAINDMGFMDNQFNSMHLPQVTAKNRLLILMKTGFEASLSVELYAYMFNMPKAEIQERTILLNDWTKFDNDRMKLLFTDVESGAVSPDFVPFTEEEIEKLNSIPLYVLDERFFKIWDYLIEFTEFRNPEKLYWNYWLHTHKIVSTSPFANGIAYTSLDNTVEEITVSPTAVTLKAGDMFRPTVTMKTSGVGRVPYTWEFDSDDIREQNGLLKLSNTVTAGSVITATVKAQDKSAAVTVTVS